MENLQFPRNKPLVILGILLVVLLFCCCGMIVAYALLEGPLTNGFSLCQEFFPRF